MTVNVNGNCSSVVSSKGFDATRKGPLINILLYISIKTNSLCFFPLNFFMKLICYKQKHRYYFKLLDMILFTTKILQYKKVLCMTDFSLVIKSVDRNCF